jgi:hypothetical protein
MATTTIYHQGRKIVIADTVRNGTECMTTTIDGVALSEHISLTAHRDLVFTAKGIIDGDDPRLPELGLGRPRVSLEYKGRRITAIRRKRDGFSAIEILINGEHYFDYGALSGKRLRTIAGAVEQTRRDLDAVDEQPEPAYAAHMYRADDPRRVAVLARLNWED